MKTNQAILKKSIYVGLILMLLSVALSACNLPGLTPAPQNQSMPAAVNVPTEAATTAPAAPAAASTCPVGKWQLSDFTTYFTSLQAMIASKSTDVKITNNGQSGTAYFTFNTDGTAAVTTDNFTQKFTLTTTINKINLDVPATVAMNGTSTAHYTVAGDQISFDQQNIGDLKIVVTVMGKTTDASDALMGKAGSVTLYQFTCPDTNTLTLKVTSAKVDLAPLSLTRVP
jgi:hypothetical protein